MSTLDNTNKSDPRPDQIAAEIASSLKKSNSGSHPDPIAPVTVGEPSDAKTFKIDQRHMEDFINPEMKPGVVECRRPPKGTFFTVIPEREGEDWRNRAFYFVLEMEGRDPHIVEPPVAKIKLDEEDTIRPVLIVRYVTMTGQEGLWAVKLNPPEGKANRWNTSAMNVLNVAESGTWVRIISKNEYRYQVSNKTLKDTPPKFTDRTFEQMIGEAFPPDRRIKTLDHPIWEELANGRTK